MKLHVTKESFTKAYGLKDEASYERFKEKLCREFEKSIHPFVAVGRFDFSSSWKDSGNNIHARWEGEVTGWGQGAEIGGEFVWLRRTGSFRGRLWSKLERFTDLQLSTLARQEFRAGNLANARDYIDTIQVIDDLPRSVSALKSIIEAKIRSERFLTKNVSSC